MLEVPESVDPLSAWFLRKHVCADTYQERGELEDALEQMGYVVVERIEKIKKKDWAQMMAAAEGAGCDYVFEYRSRTIPLDVVEPYRVMVIFRKKEKAKSTRRARAWTWWSKDPS